MELVFAPQVDDALNSLHGPVVATYNPEVAPLFHAPDEFCQAWVGLQLPVRSDHLGNHVLRTSRRDPQPIIELLGGETDVAVIGMDGVRALLEAGHNQAAVYWSRKILLDRVHFSTRQGLLHPMPRS